MKAFAASLILLAVLAGCAVINCIYIDRTVDKLTALEKSFPEKNQEGELQLSDELKSAVTTWENAAKCIGCTSNMKYINAVTLALDNLTDFYKHGSPADYIAARHLFIESLKALKNADSLSLISSI